MKNIAISLNVIRRLPRYLRRLDELCENGIYRISSAEFGHQLGLTPSQIRQDLCCFGEFGQQGYGYNVKHLRGEIASILGMNRGFNAILVGCGNLGRALACNFDFTSYGISLNSIFDINSEIVGSTVNDIDICDIDYLQQYLECNPTDIAALCVPKSAANSTAEMLVQNGIRAIWNFTNQELTVPHGIIVENVHFSDSLLTLSYQITNTIKDE